MRNIKQMVSIELILGLLLIGMFLAPIFPNEGEIPEPDTIPNSEFLGYDPDGDLMYNTKIPMDSKASAMLLAPDNVEKYTWHDNGDGDVGINDGDSDYWDETSTAMWVSKDTPGYDEHAIWLSIEIGSTFQSSSVTKSLDDTDIMLRCSGKNNLEDDETLRAKEILTNNQCGPGGDSDCNSHTEVYGFGKSGSYDEVTVNQWAVNGWATFDIDGEGFLQIGDSGQINFWIYYESNWGSSESIGFYTSDSASNPYLDIDYTLWSAPTANSGDITGEPAGLFPWQDYGVQTIIRDADGRTNINDAYLYISADHATFVVRFDWDRATNTFSQGLGAAYVTFNTTDSSSANEGANGYTLTWNFTVLVTWQEGYMDWGNYATDLQGKTSSVNWNNLDTFYTNRFWVQELAVEWITEAVNLTDGDSVYTVEVLNITGFVFWNTLMTIYDLSEGTPRVELVEDGINNGTFYNDTIDAAGFFNISYTTPATEDWTWSLTVEINATTLPTGITEAPNNDVDVNPLFLIADSSPLFGATGTTVTVTLQPNNIVPYDHEISDTDVYMNSFLPYTAMIANDNVHWRSDWFGGKETVVSNFVQWYYAVGYPNALDYLHYETKINGGGGTGGTHTLWIGDRVGTRTAIFAVGAVTTASGIYDVTDGHWSRGIVELELQADEGNTALTYWQIDQMWINFTSITEEQVSVRKLNGTVVWDTITVEILQHDVNVTITGIPNSYSLVQIHNEEGLMSITDNIVTTGSLVLEGCAKGAFSVILDTNMTWHEVSFSPTLPDGLSENWQIFEWYVNETHLNKMPYGLDDGFYYLRVQDGFDNDIVNTNFTIAADDPLEIMYGRDLLGVIPLYHLEIPNADDVNYDLEFVRNAQSAWFTLTALTTATGIRVYGIEGGADYSVYVYPSGDPSWVTMITVSMPDRAYVYNESIDLVADLIIVEFSRLHWDDYTVYYKFRSRDGGARLNITQDGAERFTDYPEDYAYYWDKDTVIGTHIVNVTATKDGFANLLLNFTYTVQDAALKIEILIPPAQTAGTNISMTLTTNWGNTTLVIDEYTWDPSVGGWHTAPKTIYTTIGEGSITWVGDFSSDGVKVDVLVNGTSQEIERTFYYSKAVQQVHVAVGSPPPVVIPGVVVKPTRLDTFMSNLPYIILIGAGIFGMVWGSLKTERVKVFRRKRKAGKKPMGTRIKPAAHKQYDEDGNRIM